MNAIEQVRNDNKSIYNRFRSIQHDANFVRYVAERIKALPVVANERAGTWYTDPKLRNHGTSAYFKSTDGHHGQWDFNLRRLNRPLLELITASTGCILVDITRKGKRFPDSLAKTVPLWCAVINRATQLYRLSVDTDGNQTNSSNLVWDTKLHCPSNVSQSEHAQMSELIDIFAQKLLTSCADLTLIYKQLLKPLRPLWITPVTRMFLGCHQGEQLWNEIKTDLDFYPVICVSASMDPLHMKTSDVPIFPLKTDFVYIQGAADDSEMWAPGLTSSLFWEYINSHELLQSTPQQCHHDIHQLISQSQSDQIQSSMHYSLKKGSAFDWIGDTGIAIGSFHAADPSSCWNEFDVIINCGAREFPENTIYKNAEQGKLYVYLDIPEGKKGQNKLFDCIPAAIQCVQGKFMSQGRRILVHCMQGRDRSVGICLALLVEYMDANWIMSPTGKSCRGQLDKDTIRNRLLYIQRFRMVASPSRATLKKINLYFLETNDHSNRDT
ncbi:tRNA A64-2'-O-ribosylphosphate transferase [Batrachochytrium dendrobatidis]|nr:tRNA A64-2'-O-ribosylphosphate transferase [Batrachochytrium dendrobatidis]